MRISQSSRRLFSGMVSAVTAAVLMIPQVPATAADTTVTVGKEIAVDGAYEGKISDLGSDISTITFYVTCTQACTFSYGGGVSTSVSPDYWQELKEGKADLKANTSTPISFDVSDIKLGYSGGTYQFRNYWSAGTLTLDKVVGSGAGSTTPTPPTTPSEPATISYENSVTDNKDGTATLRSTVSRQLDNLDYKLTIGYDEDFYQLNPEEKTEDAPINSKKFAFQDFGITSMLGITVQGLTVVCESEKDLDTFMYGGGIGVKYKSAADTEYAKAVAEIEGKENAGYWYNDMGAEEIEKFEEAGVEFGIDDIGTGTTLEGVGSYIEATWIPPESVKEYQSTSATDGISFQFWYGTYDAEEYTEVAKDEYVTLTSAILTYTIEKTVPYTATASKTTSEKLTYSSETANALHLDYADLGIEKDMDVYAIRFTVTAPSDIGKMVYCPATGTTSAATEYWYQEETNYVVLNGGKSVDLLWIIPDAAAGSDKETNFVNPDGQIYLGYYYGGVDSVTVSKVEVIYDQPVEETTTTPVATTTTPAATATTTPAATTTTTPAPVTTTTTAAETTAPLVPDWGNADCIADVDISDAVLVARYSVEDKEAVISDQGLVNADVTHDGAVKGDDALKIVRFAAKLITKEDLAMK